MSVRGFGPLVMAASVAGAALGCYLISLNVASERAELESVEARIVSTQRQIRVLQTEIGTRGRLAQLERWNADFIRLSAPSADQILEGGFQLASMVRPPARHSIDAPVVLAAAPADTSTAPQFHDDGATATPPGAAPRRSARPDQLMKVASYDVAVRDVQTAATPKPAATKPALSGPVPAKPVPTNVAASKVASAVGPKPVSADPLAPLPVAKPPKPGQSATAKGSVSKQ